MYSNASQTDVEITATNANKIKLSTNFVEGEYIALREVKEAKFEELVLLSKSTLLTFNKCKKENC